MQTIAVRVLRTGMYRAVCYQAGECAALPADLARRLCQRKLAELITPPPPKRKEPARDSKLA